MKYKEPGRKAPCREACPAHVDIPRYLRYVAIGDAEAAASVIREVIPFPATVGRVCFRPCEDKCNCRQLADSISINMVKRYASDTAGIVPKAFGEPTKEEKIAIIGSGPAGLTAAVCLRERGYGVDIFEREPVPGGMMTACIPEYRLPLDIVTKEIRDIEFSGVPIHLNTELGKDITLSGLFDKGYSAVFLATGAHRAVEVNMPGIEGKGVMSALGFLKKVRANRPVSIGEKVAVIGGGNAAIDAARSALRLGAKEVHILYRRTRNEMPATEEEIVSAEQEGIEVSYLVAPTGVVRDGEVITCVECCEMELGEPDGSGRRRPVPKEGSKLSFLADTVIVATGQMPDLQAGTDALRFNRQGFLEVDEETLQTSVKGVFAGGDVLYTSSVTEAIAQGRRAAEGIARFLGDLSAEDRRPREDLRTWPLQGYHLRAKRPRNLLSMEERIDNFNEVDRGFDCQMARGESNQCLRCDVPILIDAAKCTGCQTCAYYCSLSKLGYFNPLKANIKVRVNTVLGKLNEISFTDECEDCGICARYCPYGALTRADDFLRVSEELSQESYQGRVGHE